MHYALTRNDSEAAYEVYGKGDDIAEAERDAARNIRDDFANAAALRENLITLTREEAERRGFVAPGAPVIWYDYLRHYRVEAHDRYHPLPGEQLLRNMLR